MKFKQKRLKTGKRVERGQVAVVNSRTTPRLARWLVPVLVAVLTGAAFFPLLENGFVDWDDEKTLLDNPNYRGLGWAQLRWMFTTFYMGHYQPLTWMTFGLDYLLWGLDPFGYHLTNLLLHAANAVLFYFISIRLLTLSVRVVPGELALRVTAGFAALIFAIHPLRVESVAWATERRDVLSGLFFLLTILCYLRATAGAEVDSARWRWLSAAVIVYGLSLLSKASGITLPIVLLVLDVYPLRRLGAGAGKWFWPAARRVWVEKVPFFLLAIAIGMVALFAQQEAGALKAVERYGLFSRLAQAFFGIAFYLWKEVVPLWLSPLYELPTGLDPWDWPFTLSGLVVLTISVVLFLVRRRWPAGLAIWVCYVVLLAPVLGVAQSGPQIAADRYSYLSCLGWAVLAGAGILYCWQLWASGHIRSITFMLAPGLAVAVLAVLGVLTWKQAQVWHDSERLWKYAVTVSPESSTVHYNLAFLLHKRGELQEAMEHYRQALQINPIASDAHNNLGNVLAQRGELEKAMEHYRQALQINPSYTQAYNNLGNALAQRGELDEAIKNYRQALQINPAAADSHYNLGGVLAQRGELEEAIKHYREALKLSPADSEIHFDLGNALARQGHLEEAIDHLRIALRIQPDFAEAHESLGRALAQQGKRDEAVKHYQEALRILKSRPEASAPR
ncbi:MAG: tetratricopeptide repeat protein [Candidatus Binatia bacterium]